MSRKDLEQDKQELSFQFSEVEEVPLGLTACKDVFTRNLFFPCFTLGFFLIIKVRPQGVFSGASYSMEVLE